MGQASQCTSGPRDKCPSSEGKEKHTRNTRKEGHAVDNLLARLSRIKVPSKELTGSVACKLFAPLESHGNILHTYLNVIPVKEEIHPSLPCVFVSCALRSIPTSHITHLTYLRSSFIRPLTSGLAFFFNLIVPEVSIRDVSTSTIFARI